MVYKKRESFQTRISNVDDETKSYYDKLVAKLLSYKKLKSRVSLRCVSFRQGRKLMAKIALGGKTLKLYLAINPNLAELSEGKYHPRDLSETKAYEEVPTMLPIKSDLAVRKACQVIDMMMQ